MRNGNIGITLIMNDISNLAAEITNTPIQQIPKLLIKFKDFAISVLESRQNLDEFGNDVLAFQILPLFINILRQDFSMFNEESEIANKLSETLRLLIICLESSNLEVIKYEKFLPKCIESLLFLCYKLNGSINKPKRSETKYAITNCIKNILHDVTIIINSFRTLFGTVISSRWLFELLSKVTNKSDIDIYVHVVNFLSECCLISENVASKNLKYLGLILDEIIHKLNAVKNDAVSSTSLKFIYNLAEKDERCLEIIRSQYENSNEMNFKGLSTLIRKFQGGSVDTEIQLLSKLLKEGSLQSKEEKRRNQAARKIQAHYRGYRTRKSLAAANKAFTKFQRLFREHMRVKEALRVKAIEKKSSEISHKIQRKQLFIRENEKQLDIISVMPADSVEKYFNDRQNKAAVKIQATWKGYHTRWRLSQVKNNRIREDAACIIQKTIRRWLEKRRNIRRHTKVNVVLSDAELDHYQNIIDEQRNTYKKQNMNNFELNEQYKITQKSLKHFYDTLPTYRRIIEHSDNIGAQICDLSNNICFKNLLDITEEDGKLLWCSSVKVVNEAKSLHQKCLMDIREPRWKKLLKNEDV